MNYYKQYEPIFGSWHITRLIGEGSFGKVFEMERQDFGVTSKAALKAITVPAIESEVRDVTADVMDEESIRSYYSTFVQNLVKEFDLMGRLKGSSNIVSYENHQIIEHKEGIGWDILIQMELLTPLNYYIQKNTVTRQDVIRLGIDMCKALELCQKYNIIHRDIKPENIFISDNGDFKLDDFGVAHTVEKTTSGLSMKGTYSYMAPEVYMGKDYDSTVDIYSLGLVLYRLLNGNRIPFLPAAPAPITYLDQENALAKRFSGAPIPQPQNGDGRLDRIVLKACAFDPRERYSVPLQMREDLEAILYNREEDQYVYPEGDEAPQKSVLMVRFLKKFFHHMGDKNTINEDRRDKTPIKWTGPTYTIRFCDINDPTIPYYSIEGQPEKWIKAPSNGCLYHDPIEDTPEFKLVADTVDKLVDEEMKGHIKGMGSCHLAWSIKKRILKEKYGIEWHSVSDLNPLCRFD